MLTPRGEWQTPILFGVLDDRSRLACHLQWYLSETAEVVVHGLSQAFQKRGLPRASLSDNGAAMNAAEVVEGLTRLGVLQQTTLPYTPEANAKIEILWASVEGRLMAMLEHVSDLSLARLNEATLAWVEHEYNRRINSETGETPIARFLAGPSVMRPCPDSAALRLAFTRTERRMQRKSDGTLVLDGRRLEVTDRYRHLTQLEENPLATASAFFAQSESEHLAHSVESADPRVLGLNICRPGVSARFRRAVCPILL